MRSKEAHFKDILIMRSIDAIFGHAVCLPLLRADKNELTVMAML